MIHLLWGHQNLHTHFYQTFRGILSSNVSIGRWFHESTVWIQPSIRTESTNLDSIEIQEYIKVMKETTNKRYGKIWQANMVIFPDFLVKKICPLQNHVGFFKHTFPVAERLFWEGFHSDMLFNYQSKQSEQPSLASTNHPWLQPFVKKKTSEIQGETSPSPWQPPDLESYVAIAVSWVYPCLAMSCYVVLGEISGWHVERICWTTWTVETNGCILKRLVHSLYLPSTNIYKVHGVCL